MQRIKASQLKEGMRFSAPVFFDDGQNMFLAEDKPVKLMHIQALSRWRVPFLLTYGKLISDDSIYDENSTGLEELEDLEVLDDDIPLEQNVEYLEQIAKNFSTKDSKLILEYKQILNDADRTYESIRLNQSELVRSEIDTLCDDIIELVSKDYTDILSTILTDDKEDSSIPKNAVITAIFSAILARHTNLASRKLRQIITAALLHDTGMLSVDPSILEKREYLTSEEFNLVQLHIVRSTQYAQDQLFYSREIGTIIQQHHERWNGSGYPDRLRGSEIDIGSRIVSISDSFSAMLSRKSYRDSFDGYEAMKKLLDARELLFDPDLIKVFINIIGIYPIGSLVLLNNGAIAQVIKANSEMPLLPEIRILVSSTKTPPVQVGDEILLQGNQDLKILRVIKQDEYRAAN